MKRCGVRWTIDGIKITRTKKALHLGSAVGRRERIANVDQFNGNKSGCAKRVARMISWVRAMSSGCFQGWNARFQGPRLGQ